MQRAPACPAGGGAAAGSESPLPRCSWAGRPRANCCAGPGVRAQMIGIRGSFTVASERCLALVDYTPASAVDRDPEVIGCSRLGARPNYRRGSVCRLPNKSPRIGKPAFLHSTRRRLYAMGSLDSLCRVLARTDLRSRRS